MLVCVLVCRYQRNFKVCLINLLRTLYGHLDGNDGVIELIQSAELIHSLHFFSFLLKTGIEKGARTKKEKKNCKNAKLN